MISSSYYLLWSKSTFLYDEEYPLFWWQRKITKNKEGEQERKLLNSTEQRKIIQ
jgi:hypothetical protein